MSFARYTKVLQTEHKKQLPNTPIVEELMSSSFALRRADLLQNNHTITDVFQKYPFLNNPDHIHHNIMHIAGSLLAHLMSSQTAPHVYIYTALSPTTLHTLPAQSHSLLPHFHTLSHHTSHSCTHSVLNTLCYHTSCSLPAHFMLSKHTSHFITLHLIAVNS